MSGLAPLAMSQKKEELLRYLGLSHETYHMMAKETDEVYRWLTTEQHHLKKNCKRKAPYDWSDILERSKDEAMERIATSGSQYTAHYWAKADPSDECPNWIARWFLYHKFRYRDGRNRNPVRREEGRQSSPHHHSSMHHSHSGRHGESSRSTNVAIGGSSDYSTSQPEFNSNHPSYQYSESVNYVATFGNGSLAYIVNEAHGRNDEPNGSEGQASGAYYDPVRDTRRLNR